MQTDNFHSPTQLYYPNNFCIKCLRGLSLLSDFCLLYPHSKASVNGKEYFHGSGEVSIFPIFFSFLTNCQIFPKLIFYPVCLSDRFYLLCLICQADTKPHDIYHLWPDIRPHIIYYLSTKHQTSYFIWFVKQKPGLISYRIRYADSRLQIKRHILVQ